MTKLKKACCIHLFSLKRVSRASVTPVLLNTQASEQNSYGSFGITLRKNLSILLMLNWIQSYFFFIPFRLLQLKNLTVQSVPVFPFPPVLPWVLHQKKKKKKFCFLFCSAKPLVKTSVEQVSPVISPPGLCSLHQIPLLFSTSSYHSLYKNRSLSSQKIWMSKSLKLCGVLLFTTSTYLWPSACLHSSLWRSRVCQVWMVWFRFLQLVSAFWNPWI